MLVVDASLLAQIEQVLVARGPAGPFLSFQQARELQEFVKQNTAPFKYPRWIEFVAALPKTATGKIKRFELREWLAAAKAKAAGQQPPLPAQGAA